MPSTPKCNCNIYKDHIVIHESHCNIQKQSTQPNEKIIVSWDISADCGDNWVVQFWRYNSDNTKTLITELNSKSDECGNFELAFFERAKLLKEIEEKIKKEVATITEDRLNCIKEILSLLNSIRN